MFLRAGGSQTHSGAHFYHETLGNGWMELVAFISFWCPRSDVRFRFIVPWVCLVAGLQFLSPVFLLRLMGCIPRFWTGAVDIKIPGCFCTWFASLPNVWDWLVGKAFGAGVQLSVLELRFRFLALYSLPTNDLACAKI